MGLQEDSRTVSKNYRGHSQDFRNTEFVTLQALKIVPIQLTAKLYFLFFVSCMQGEMPEI